MQTIEVTIGALKRQVAASVAKTGDLSMAGEMGRALDDISRAAAAWESDVSVRLDVQEPLTVEAGETVVDTLDRALASILVRSATVPAEQIAAHVPHLGRLLKVMAEARPLAAALQNA